MKCGRRFYAVGRRGKAMGRGNNMRKEISAWIVLRTDGTPKENILTGVLEIAGLFPAIPSPAFKVGE